MTVGMPHVHFANVPGHVGRRPRHFQALLDAAPVYGVDIVYPDRHPHGLLGGLVRLRAERHRLAAAAAAALPALAEKDLALPGAHAAERRWRAPVPAFFPAELVEPREAFLDVRDVQDRG